MLYDGRDDLARAQLVFHQWRRSSIHFRGYGDLVGLERQNRLGTTASWLHRELAESEALLILVGSETSQRSYVQTFVELAEKFNLPMHSTQIHNILDEGARKSMVGRNPLDLHICSTTKLPLSSVYSSSDYTQQNGSTKLGVWLTEALRERELHFLASHTSPEMTGPMTQEQQFHAHVAKVHAKEVSEHSLRK